jgi:hypothetical protein
VSSSNTVEATLKTAITPEEMAALLKEAGFRADVVNVDKQMRVRSAAQGLEFSILFAGPANDQHYTDFSFHCPLRIKGELPDGIINRWNRSKRFARLARNEHFLYVTMDVILAGGVTLAHLRLQCELWDRLIRELFMHLQQPLGDSLPLAPTAAA